MARAGPNTDLLNATKLMYQQGLYILSPYHPPQEEEPREPGVPARDGACILPSSCVIPGSAPELDHALVKIGRSTAKNKGLWTRINEYHTYMPLSFYLFLTIVTSPLRPTEEELDAVYAQVEARGDDHRDRDRDRDPPPFVSTRAERPADPHWASHLERYLIRSLHFARLTELDTEYKPRFNGEWFWVSRSLLVVMVNRAVWRFRRHIRFVDRIHAPEHSLAWCTLYNKHLVLARDPARPSQWLPDLFEARPHTDSLGPPRVAALAARAPVPARPARHAHVHRPEEDVCPDDAYLQRQAQTWDLFARSVKVHTRVPFFQLKVLRHADDRERIDHEEAFLLENIAAVCYSPATGEYRFWARPLWSPPGQNHETWWPASAFHVEDITHFYFREFPELRHPRHAVSARAAMRDAAAGAAKISAPGLRAGDWVYAWDPRPDRRRYNGPLRILRAWNEDSPDAEYTLETVAATVDEIQRQARARYQKDLNLPYISDAGGLAHCVYVRGDGSARRPWRRRHSRFQLLDVSAALEYHTHHQKYHYTITEVLAHFPSARTGTVSFLVEWAAGDSAGAQVGDGRRNNSIVERVDQSHLQAGDIVQYYERLAGPLREERRRAAPQMHPHAGALKLGAPARGGFGLGLGLVDCSRRGARHPYVGVGAHEAQAQAQADADADAHEPSPEPEHENRDRGGQNKFRSGNITLDFVADVLQQAREFQWIARVRGVSEGPVALRLVADGDAGAPTVEGALLRTVRARGENPIEAFSPPRTGAPRAGAMTRHRKREEEKEKEIEKGSDGKKKKGNTRKEIKEGTRKKGAAPKNTKKNKHTKKSDENTYRWVREQAVSIRPVEAESIIEMYPCFVTKKTIVGEAKNSRTVYDYGRKGSDILAFLDRWLLESSRPPIISVS